MNPEPLLGSLANALFHEAIDQADSSLDIRGAIPRPRHGDGIMHNHLEPRALGPLNGHGLKHRSKSQSQPRRSRCRVGQMAKERCRDAAIELLIIHQRDGLATPHGLEKFARAITALGCKEPHAIAKPALLDSIIDIGIVGCPIGHLASHSRINDRGGHDLPVGQMT